MKPDNLKIVQQQTHLQTQAPPMPYSASTASSTASGGSSTSTHKKQISPIIAAAADTAAATAKAAAAISASMAPTSIYDNFNVNRKAIDDQTSPTFSNDTVPVSMATPLNAPPRIKMIDTDIDDIEDIDLDIGPNDQLSRLYEEKETELPPPSFNTAVRKEASNSYRHQYQNSMDLEALVKR